MLGLLSLGPGAVVSHEAAARLHGFDRCLEDAVEFTVPRGIVTLAAQFSVHSTNDLPPIDQDHDRWLPLHIGDPHDHRPGPSAHPEDPAGVGDRLGGPVGSHCPGRPRDEACRAARAGTVGCATARRPAARQRRSHAPRASVPAADAHGRAAEAATAGRSIGAMGRRSPVSTSCSRTTASSSRCPGGRVTLPTPSGRGTRSAATSFRTIGRKVFEFTYRQVTREQDRGYVDRGTIAWRDESVAT